jgi:hypothetical protein
MVERTYKWGNLIRLLLAVAVSSWYVLLCIAQKRIVTDEFSSMWDIVSASGGVYGFYIAFDKYLWKWRIFRGWLVDFPILIGEWEGLTISSYDGKERPIEMAIYQTYSSVHVKHDAAQSTSKTIVASLLHQPDCTSWRVIYTYINEPDGISKTGGMHYGTAFLDYDTRYPDILKGFYYTTRGTGGKMEITRVHVDASSDEIEETKEVI